MKCVNSVSKNWGLLSVGEALALLDQRILPAPSVDDFSRILRSCKEEKNQEQALRVHAHLRELGLDAHLELGSHLMLVLVGVGSISAASHVFDRLVYQDSSSWNSLIIGYAQHGEPQEALTFYQRLRDGILVHLTEYAFRALIKACTKLRDLDSGREIHVETVKLGLTQSNLFIGSSLVDMYAKCGFLGEAQDVFDGTPARDAVLWTALLAGYAEYGHGTEALCCFQQMQKEGFSPDAVCFLCGVKACSSMKAIIRGQEIFSDVVRLGLEREPHLTNTLIDLYGKCGLIGDARAVFDIQPVRSIVSWNLLIAAYTEHGSGEEVLQCFTAMQQAKDIFPDANTYLCSLKACGSIGIMNKGQEIHADVSRRALQKDIVVGSSIVDMYAKCGMLAKAQEVFDRLTAYDVVSWTSLVAGYAQWGDCDKVFATFERMIQDGVEPNFVTFVNILTACNHAGAVVESERYVECMYRDYGILPICLHYTCIIDILGRAGHIDKAVVLTERMPFQPGTMIWHTVLSACEKGAYIEGGEVAFEHSICLDEKDAGAYICMSNIYANAGMQKETKKIEALRREKQLGGSIRCPMFGSNCLTSLVERQEMVSMCVPKELLVRSKVRTTMAGRHGSSKKM